MILGDFRADGASVTDKQMQNIRIRSDRNFHWLIGDDVDTTSATTNNHIYDRQGLFLESLWQTSCLYSTS